MVTFVELTPTADPAAQAAAAWEHLSAAQRKAVGAAFDPTDLAVKAESAIQSAAELSDAEVLDVATRPWDASTGPERQIVAACNEAIARDLAAEDLATQINSIRSWRESAIRFLARPSAPDSTFAAFIPHVRAVYAPRAAALTSPTTDTEVGRFAASELWLQASAANPARSPAVMDAWLKHHLVFIHGRGTPYNRDKAAAFNDELLRLKLVVTTWDKA